MSDLTALLDRVDASMDAARDRLFAALRIASVSAQPAPAPDCAAAAGFYRDQLAAIGFTAEIRPTNGHPVVLAHHQGTGQTAPRLLFYGHYDVQPAEPLDLWTSHAFDPVLAPSRHGGTKIVARGAVDDKGQVATWLEALRAWHDIAGGPPLPVTVLIEGEEEVGSANLEPFLAAHTSELAADAVVVSDTNMWSIDQPAITTSLRGLVYAHLTLRGPSRDLHSGLYGGAALNPINALTAILGQLHDGEGRVTIPGFYDGVAEVEPARAASWSRLGFDEAAFLGDIGLSTPAGERDRTTLERLWARPTADINGIWGGYQGPGAKTVIASEAGAKVSFRLVPGQEPARIADGFRQFVTERAPPGATISFGPFGLAPAMRVPTDSRFVRAASRALEAEYGRPPALIGGGGSIPIIETFRRVLGVEALLMGFGLDDDQIHSPNEKFEMACLHHGIRAHVRLLAELAGSA